MDDEIDSLVRALERKIQKKHGEDTNNFVDEVPKEAYEHFVEKYGKESTAVFILGILDEALRDKILLSTSYDAGDDIPPPPDNEIICELEFIVFRGEGARRHCIEVSQDV